MPEKSDEERHAEFCAEEDEKYGPGHCNCMRGPRAKGADRVKELLDALRKALDEMEASGVVDL